MVARTSNATAAEPASPCTEGDDEHQAEADPAERDGGQHHHQRRRAGEEPARHAEREQAPPAERVRGEVRMAVAVTMVVVMVPARMLAERGFEARAHERGAD